MGPGTQVLPGLSSNGFRFAGFWLSKKFFFQNQEQVLCCVDQWLNNLDFIVFQYKTGGCSYLAGA